MKRILRIFCLILTACGASTIVGCSSLNGSVTPIETWKPAVVNETTLQALQSEVSDYSSELSRILNQSNRKEGQHEKASTVSEL